MQTWQSNSQVAFLGIHVFSYIHKVQALGYNKFNNDKFLKHLKEEKSEIMMKWEFYQLPGVG